MDNSAESLSKTLAAAVRVEMARGRIKQTKMMADLDWSQPKLARRLAGETPFTLDELPAVAAALGITTAELFANSLATYEAQFPQVVAA